MNKTKVREVMTREPYFVYEDQTISPNVQSWPRSLVIAQLYGKDISPAVTFETGEEE